MRHNVFGRMLTAVFMAAFLSACSSGMKTTPAANQPASVANQTSAGLTLADVDKKLDGDPDDNTFNSFNLGAAVGQQGWLGDRCQNYSNSQIVAVSAFPNAKFSGDKKKWPTRALQVQNIPGASDQCYDGLGSPPLAKPAGMEDSFISPQPPWVVCGEACRNHFTSSWTVTSASGAYDPTIGMSVSPVYTNYGARMAYVAMVHEPDPHGKPSLHLYAIDVEGVCDALNVCPGTASPPCASCANFVQYDVAFVDPTVAHTIGLTIDFGQGKKQRDRVTVSVDGKNMWTGGSWQDYYTMDTESDPGGLHPGSRAVNDLLLHSNGNGGSGLLFSNVAVSTN
jgi:hypothetical protein